MNRVVVAHTPLPEDSLRFRSMRGSEGLSSLYEFTVELVSESPTLDMKSLLGKPLTLEIETQDRGRRYLGGQIVRCELSGRETDTPRSYLYTLTLRPGLWYLTKTSDCRIFQNKNVLEILDEVFGKYGFPVHKRVFANYRTWEYCVQYQESDFAFVCRLMEHEGIYYYFRHELDQQTLVLADELGSHDELPGHASLPYLFSDRMVLQDEPGIDQWRSAEEVRSGAYSVDDYDFKKPGAKLGQALAAPFEHDHAQYEKYIWQGGYIEAEQGAHYARIRLEAEQAEHARIQAHSKIRAIACGSLFALTGCPREAENRQYLIVAVDYALQEGGYASGSSDSHYDLNFVVQPAQLPFRAPCTTPVPKATGPQTAVVVGPPGQIIWTDQYGRVKLQFRWDRYGRGDENSSCWVRVSDAWAGTNYGSVHVPRIGQEVVVDFLNGQMDRPLITGRIYNAEQMPPFELPVSSTQSGFVTRTPGGGPENANMLRFEDQQGSEQVRLHAERDYDVSAEHDSTYTVANKLLMTVGTILTPHDGPQSPLKLLGQGAAGTLPPSSPEKVPEPNVTTLSGKAQESQSASAAAAAASSAQGVEMPAQADPPTSQVDAKNPVNVSTGLADISAKLASASVTMFSLSVQGLSVSVVFGGTISVVTGNQVSILNGNSFSDTNGNQTSFLNGNSTSVVNGNSDSTLHGCQASLVMGNSTSVLKGSSQSTTMGSTWSYTQGNATSTTIGNTFSTVQGNTTSLTVGNSMSTTEGNVTSTTVGNVTTTTMANLTNMTVGNETATTVGRKTETVVSDTTTTYIGNKNSLTVGSTQNVNVGSATTVNATHATSISASTLSETGSSISHTGLSVSITEFGYSDTRVDLKKAQTKVEMIDGTKMTF